MAFAEKTTYAIRIQNHEALIQSLKTRIETEKSLILDIKRPASLLACLISPSLRATNIHQASQARSRIAQLQMQLTQSEAELGELKRLHVQFPEHDRLVDRANVVGFQNWELSVQEEELDAYERSLFVQQRLEDRRFQQEEEAIQKELAEIEAKQKELEARKAKLSKKTS